MRNLQSFEIFCVCNVLFFSESFNDVFFVFSFQHLKIFFGFGFLSLLGICWAYWIYQFISCTKIGKFLAIICPDFFFFHFPLLNSIEINVRPFGIVPQVPEALNCFSVFFFFFLFRWLIPKIIYLLTDCLLLHLCSILEPIC